MLKLSERQKRILLLCGIILCAIVSVLILLFYFNKPFQDAITSLFKTSQTVPEIQELPTEVPTSFLSTIQPEEFVQLPTNLTDIHNVIIMNSNTQFGQGILMSVYIPSNENCETTSINPNPSILLSSIITDSNGNISLNSNSPLSVLFNLNQINCGMIQYISKNEYYEISNGMVQKVIPQTYIVELPEISSSTTNYTVEDGIMFQNGVSISLDNDNQGNCVIDGSMGQIVYHLGSSSTLVTYTSKTKQGSSYPCWTLNGSITSPTPDNSFPCAANYGSTTACCGQDSEIGYVEPEYRCPQEFPICQGYNFSSNTLGTCKPSSVLSCSESSDCPSDFPLCMNGTCISKLQNAGYNLTVGKNSLLKGNSLGVCQMLTSENGVYCFVLQSDGNLCIFQNPVSFVIGSDIITQTEVFDSATNTNQGPTAPYEYIGCYVDGKCTFNNSTETASCSTSYNMTGPVNDQATVEQCYNILTEKNSSSTDNNYVYFGMENGKNNVSGTAQCFLASESQFQNSNLPSQTMSTVVQYTPSSTNKNSFNYETCGCPSNTTDCGDTYNIDKIGGYTLQIYKVNNDIKINSMTSSQTLTPCSSLISLNAQFNFQFSSNGSLSICNGDNVSSSCNGCVNTTSVVWNLPSKQTKALTNGALVIENGDLRMYNNYQKSNQVLLWNTNTAYSGSDTLKLTNVGFLVLYNSSTNRIFWVNGLGYKAKNCSSASGYCVYSSSTPIWSSQQNGKNTFYNYSKFPLTKGMQNLKLDFSMDGNLTVIGEVPYTCSSGKGKTTSSNTIWGSNTTNSTSDTLLLTNNGTLLIFNSITGNVYFDSSNSTYNFKKTPTTPVLNLYQENFTSLTFQYSTTPSLVQPKPLQVVPQNMVQTIGFQNGVELSGTNSNMLMLKGYEGGVEFSVNSKKTSLFTVVNYENNKLIMYNYNSTTTIGNYYVPIPQTMPTPQSEQSVKSILIVNSRNYTNGILIQCAGFPPDCTVTENDTISNPSFVIQSVVVNSSTSPITYSINPNQLSCVFFNLNSILCPSIFKILSKKTIYSISFDTLQQSQTSADNEIDDLILNYDTGGTLLTVKDGIYFSNGCSISLDNMNKGNCIISTINSQIEFNIASPGLNIPSQQITNTNECSNQFGTNYNYCPDTGVYYCCGVCSNYASCPSNDGLEYCACSSVYLARYISKQKSSSWSLENDKYLTSTSSTNKNPIYTSNYFSKVYSSINFVNGMELTIKKKGLSIVGGKGSVSFGVDNNVVSITSTDETTTPPASWTYP